MKRIEIVGLGMSRCTLTAEGETAIRNADVIIGAARLVAPFKALAKPVFEEYAADKIADIVGAGAEDKFCVIVSGDVGFYSAARRLLDALKEYSVKLIPGVSSPGYFFAKLGRQWQDAALISCHGVSANLADTVRRSKLTFALTGGNIPALANELISAGFDDLTAYVGENLGLPAERIFSLPVSELAAASVDKPAVLLIENPGFDDRVRFGISDGEFIRGGVPMTKAEARAVTLSNLSVRPDDICCDIGAGTGSVTAEMALAAYRGRVYAVDKNGAAIDLIRQNCKAFHIGNVKTILGEAPDALAGLPAIDAAFIGGASGRIRDTVKLLKAGNRGVRIVVNAVTLETLHEATEALADDGTAPKIVQIGVSRVKPPGGPRMMEALSPVFIIGGGGGI